MAIQGQPIQISTNGGEYHTAYCVEEDGLTFPMPKVKQFTLIDKYGQHLVFVDFDTRESFVCDTTDDVSQYVVGKDYEIKMPNA